MFHTSLIELDRTALERNIQYVRTWIGFDVRYSMVVKANAYGHGIEQIVPLAEGAGVDHFSVFSVAEAVRVCNVKSETTDVMIMGWIDHDQIEWAIENDVHFYVFTRERLDAAIATARQMGKRARIHLEIETGMHRTGLDKDLIADVIDALKDSRDLIVVEGVCTHFAGAEDMANFDRIISQIRSFNRLAAWIRAEGISVKHLHSANSAGVFNFPESVMDLVRVGIANYGYWPSSQTRLAHLIGAGEEDDPLERVLSWRSVILNVKDVAEGEYISYGESYLTIRPTKIAVIPVGYGYGYNRTLSNNGHVLIHERRVPVIGLVNMNMLVVDVTDLDSVGVGDEVVLIGTQGEMTITVSSFSDMNNGMNYEMLTRLPNHIPRVIV